MACRSETCCPPVSTYRSDAGGRATVPSGECPVPTVTIFLPDGSYVILPTFVVLTCNVVGAVIYYTTDGTEPTEESTVYSAPFQVSSAQTVVKARGKLADCDLGPVVSAQYPVLEGSSWQFDYLCDSGDKVGVFGEFAANGQANDYQFLLLFTLDADTEIVDITILQTDALGFWDSGQGWSTKEYIYPFPDPTVPFHVYPLVLIDQSGPTQLFTSYQTTLGTIVADDYEWRMWGQPFTTLNGFFLAQITLGDGTVIRRLIEATCVPPPPPCAALAAPILTAFCTPTVQLEGTAPAAGIRIWKRSTECGDGTWTLLTTMPAGAWIYHDAPGLTRCCTYEYYADYLCDGNYVASPVASILVPCACIILLGAEDEICAGEDVTIDFIGSHCVGEISWGTGGEVGSFTGTGVLSGAITVSPAVTTTYTFKGTSDSCGDYFAEVTITVLSVCCFADLTIPREQTAAYPTLRLDLTGASWGSGFTGLAFAVDHTWLGYPSGGDQITISPGTCPGAHKWFLQEDDPITGALRYAGYRNSTSPLGAYTQTAGFAGTTAVVHLP